MLPPGAAVDSGPAGYRLDLAEPEAVDAVRFERLAAEGRRALAGGDPAAAAGLLREALGLWRGPALADVADAAYAAAPAARWEELRLACLDDRIEADLQLGRHADAVPELEALVGEHPLRERFRALLVRALAGAGRQAEALAAYETTRAMLADQLGVDPSAELQAVHLAVLRGDLAPRPAAAAPRPLRGNLRASLTSFVGRDDDIERIGDLLGRSRLVTLVGPGGAGKTRLSGEAARRLPAPPADGVWLVELAPLSDPADIPAAILGTLDLLDPGRIDPRPATAGDLLGPVLDALGDRDVLLLLDNCEHLVDAVAKTAEQLLGRVPAAAGAGDQPRAARHLRRVAVAGAAAGVAGRRHRGAGGGPRGARGAAVRRPRRAGAPRLRARRRRRSTPSSRSAAGSTACRSRSSSPPPGCGRCRSRRSPPGSATGSGCSPAAAAPRCRGTRRCAPS